VRAALQAQLSMKDDIGVIRMDGSGSGGMVGMLTLFPP